MSKASTTNTAFEVKHCTQIEWLKEFHDLLYLNTEDYYVAADLAELVVEAIHLKVL